MVALNIRQRTPDIEPPKVIVLVGPTASGKTPLSLIIAEHLNAEIISADSRQIYKLMDIGTAKPDIEDRQKIKHYFVDELFPDQEFNAGEFGMQGRLIIDDILQRKKVPMVVGGSGLYVRSLIDGFFEGSPPDSDIRKHLYDRLNREGAEILLDELKVVDPEAASKMLPTNTRRIVRALEVYSSTGVPISQLQKSKIKISFMPVLAGISWKRNILYDRINRRVDRMIESGLLEEVQRLKELGYPPALNALQTVGYKEVIEYFDGKIDYVKMIESIKQNSRRYAKRQLTWFRQDKRIKWFDAHSEKDFVNVASEVTKYYVS